jgi:hypothetical protein
MQSEADQKLIAALRTLHAALPYAGDKQVLQIGIDRLVELTTPARVDFAAHKPDCDSLQPCSCRMCDCR